MEVEKLKNLLTNVRNGDTDVDGALDQFKLLPFEDIGYAKIDNHRGLRTAVRCGDKNLLFKGGTIPKCHLGVKEKEITI